MSNQPVSEKIPRWPSQISMKFGQNDEMWLKWTHAKYKNHTPCRFWDMADWNLLDLVILRARESRKVTFWIISDFRMPYFCLRTSQRVKSWYSDLFLAKFKESASRFNVSSLDFKLWLPKVGSRIGYLIFWSFLGSPCIKTRGHMGPIFTKYNLRSHVSIQK